MKENSRTTQWRGSLSLSTLELLKVVFVLIRRSLVYLLSNRQKQLSILLPNTALSFLNLADRNTNYIQIQLHKDYSSL